jgi:hypothetical protein
MLGPEVMREPKLAWLPDIEVWGNPVLRAALGNPAAGATPPCAVEEVTVLVVSTDVTITVVTCGCVTPLGAVAVSVPPVVVPEPRTDGAVTEIPATVAPPIAAALVVTAGTTGGGMPPLDTPVEAIAMVVLVDATPVLETGIVFEELDATEGREDPPKE